MLKQRMLTAVILIPLVLVMLFYASHWFLAMLVFLVLMVCGWEWTRLIPVQTMFHRILYLFALSAAAVLCENLYQFWLLAGLTLWGLILVVVLTWPLSEKLWGKRSIVALTGLLLLPLFVYSLTKIYLLDQGTWLVFYLLLFVWAADTGAYFSGKLWGKHKLIPQVSPGKSWEGVFGGTGLALLVAVAGFFWFAPEHVLLWFALALLIALVSLLGDLAISVLKRRCHLKDTGAILPGHGGMLDRFDSLIAALPFFYGGLIVSGL